MPNLNLPDIGTLVSIVVGMTGLLILLFKAVDRRMESKTEGIVRKQTAPVINQLAAIEAKLDNGILTASKEHGEGIQRLEVVTATLVATVDNEMSTTNTHLANLSSQLETLLRERR